MFFYNMANEIKIILGFHGLVQDDFRLFLTTWEHPASIVRLNKLNYL